MTTLYMLRGLPASGKSTWAKEQIKEKCWKRVSRDDLRLMIDDGEYTPENETFIKYIQDHIIKVLSQSENTIIIDNTNLKEIDEKHFNWLANELSIDFEIMDFTDVPLEICIERDKNRSASVGEKVIRDMYEKCLQVK